MNSIVGPSFKVFFTEYNICGSREQCMGPTENTKCSWKFSFSSIQTYAKDQP